MGEAGGVKTMVWTSPPVPPSASTPSQSPREVLTYSNADTSDAAVGLLTLGQERRGGASPQLSPSSTSSARSPHPHNQGARRSPYTIAPSSPCYPHHGGGRPMSSPQTDPQNPLYSNYNSGSPGIGMSDNHCSRMSTQSPLNMEKLWAGDRSQVPHSDSQPALNLSGKLSMEGMWKNGGAPTMDSSPMCTSAVDEEEDQPMICMICEDRATGLHYGIITCEG